MKLKLRSSQPYLSATKINLGTSTPAIEPSIDLSNFPLLTAFDGGDNNIKNLNGISECVNLKELTTGSILSSVNFSLSSLPSSLKSLTLDRINNQKCFVNGNLADLPDSLEYFNGSLQNRFIKGDIKDLPRTLIRFEGSRNASISGNFSDLPSNIAYFGATTNIITDENGELVSSYVDAISGRFSDLPTSLTALNLFETNVNNSCSLYWDEIPNSLKELTITNAKLSGNLVDADHLESLYLGNSVLYYPTSSIQTQDLPRNLTYLFAATNLRGELQFLPSGISGSLTLNCPVSGTLTGIPSGITTLSIGAYGNNPLGVTLNNTVGGNISNLNTPNLTQLTITGSNTVSGDIVALKDMPLTSFNVVGANTLTGNLSSLPRTLTSYVHNNTTAGQSVGGNVRDLPPNLVTYNKAGNSGVVTGFVIDIPRSIISFTQNSSTHTLSGSLNDLPPSIVTFSSNSVNTRYSGEVVSLPRTLTSLTLQSNTLSGNFQDLPPNLTLLNIGGSQNYNLFGNLSAIPSTIRTLTLSNRKITNLSYYNGFAEGFGKKTWTNPFQSITLTVSALGVLPASHLATFLVDLTGAPWLTTGTRTLAINDATMPTISKALYPQAHAAIDLLRLPIASGGKGVTVTALTAI